MYHWYELVSGDFGFVASLSFRQVMYYRRCGYTVRAVAPPKKEAVLG